MAGTILGAAIAAALLAGCASAPPSEEVPSAEGYYRRALETLEGERVFLFFRDVDYPRAKELFQEVIDNYPYSEFATLAELRIADLEFDRGNYEEAASFYQDFIELHPTHERAPYALFRNGLSWFEQMRAADQDQGPTREAISQLEVLIERYPQSDPVPRARELLQEARDRLAQHEVMVADFYYQQGEWTAAARRYRSALEMYPQHEDHLRTAARLGFSLKRLRRDYEAEVLLRRVIDEGVEGELLDAVVGELEDLRNGGGAGLRPLPRSCATDPNPACPQDGDETDVPPRP